MALNRPNETELLKAQLLPIHICSPTLPRDVYVMPFLFGNKNRSEIVITNECKAKEEMLTAVDVRTQRNWKENSFFKLFWLSCSKLQKSYCIIPDHLRTPSRPLPQKKFLLYILWRGKAWQLSENYQDCIRKVEKTEKIGENQPKEKVLNK